MAQLESVRPVRSPSEGASGDGAPSAVEDPRVVQLLDEYLAAIEAGKHPDRQALLDQCPEASAELAACLDALEFVERVVRVQGDTHVPAVDETGGSTPAGATVLGDFEIVREVGRGGMGVVYEARQISLGRRVALKTLPFAAVLDPRHLQRFKNAAMAAAALDHPGIVHVYAVGCEQGIHHYAMQYLEGRTLAEVIERFRRGVETTEIGKDRLEVPGVLSSPTASTAEMLAPDTASPSAETNKVAQAEVPIGSEVTRRPDFFRTVAQWGIEAAEALHHAHEHGVVHRDIKPSNLMVDGHGHLWITDFGLAMTDQDSSLTMTGDIVGTLRYMSPEQVSGRRHGLDHRTDIYSLGVTLYELLTRRPPFSGENRQLVLRQILDEEPCGLRQFDKAIPRDLETIVLKSMAKEPRARYATAQEMADDLRRFVQNEPIQAQRMGWAARAGRWCRRNRVVAGSVAVAAAALLMWLAAMLGPAPAPEAAPPAPRAVRLATEPPGAVVVFHPLDHQTGEPQPQRAVRPEAVSPVEVELPPGDYLVVAVAKTPGYSFHEVYRRVPSPEAGLPGLFDHLGWTTREDGTVVLPDIKIPRDSVTQGMARFDGLEQLTIGTPALSEVPPHRRRVPGFWLDTTEVRVGEYRARQVYGQAFHFYQTNRLQPADDDALAFVSYDEATAYAEHIGKRLPTEWEYELAATKRGMQAFPWGEDGGRISEWKYGSVGSADWDRLETTPPVFGLYSNVAEWTSSWPTLYPAHRKAGLPTVECTGVRRIVRGGSMSIIQKQPQRAEWLRGPRFRVSLIRQSWLPGLGFRCARSAQPRLGAQDFSHEQPE